MFSACRFGVLKPLICALLSAWSWLGVKLFSVAIGSAPICCAVKPPSWVGESDCNCDGDSEPIPGTDRALISTGVNLLVWLALRFARAVVSPPSWLLVRLVIVMAFRLVRLRPLSCVAVNAWTWGDVSSPIWEIGR